MTSIVEWLEQQIEQDEAWAREASQDGLYGMRVLKYGAHWTWVDGDDDWEPTTPDPVDPDWTAKGLCSVERFPSSPVRTRHGIEHEMPIHYMYVDSLPVGVAGHIVNWDPARVLLECRSKRVIIKECILALEQHEGGLEGKVGTAAWYVLTGMALAYAERPGYVSAWTDDLPKEN